MVIHQSCLYTPTETGLFRIPSLYLIDNTGQPARCNSWGEQVGTAGYHYRGIEEVSKPIRHKRGRRGAQVMILTNKGQVLRKQTPPILALIVHISQRSFLPQAALQYCRKPQTNMIVTIGRSCWRGNSPDMNMMNGLRTLQCSITDTC